MVDLGWEVFPWMLQYAILYVEHLRPNGDSSSQTPQEKGGPAYRNSDYLDLHLDVPNLGINRRW